MRKWLLAFFSIGVIALPQIAVASGNCGIFLQGWREQLERAHDLRALGDLAGAEDILAELNAQISTEVENCEVITISEPDLPLKQSISSDDGSFSIQYPSDWVAWLPNTLLPTVSIGSTQAIADQVQSGAQRALISGEVVMGIVVSNEIGGVGAAPAPEDAEGYTSLLENHLAAAALSTNFEFSFSRPVAITLGEYAGALVLFERNVIDGLSEGVIMLLNFGDGLWMRVFSTHAAGERALMIPAFMAVGMSAAPENASVTQPDSELLPEGILTRYADLPQNIVRTGMYGLGDPEAPVSLTVYSSFACPPCGDFNNDVSAHDDILAYVREGSLTLQFVPYYITGHLPNGEGAARAAVCAGEQGAFFEMKDTLFSWQTLPDVPFTDANFNEAAAALGLDTAAFEACFDDPNTTAALDAAIELGVGAGVVGTPTVIINNRLIENRSLDSVLDAIAEALE